MAGHKERRRRRRTIRKAAAIGLNSSPDSCRTLLTSPLALPPPTQASGSRWNTAAPSARAPIPWTACEARNRAGRELPRSQLDREGGGGGVARPSNGVGEFEYGGAAVEGVMGCGCARYLEDEAVAADDAKGGVAVEVGSGGEVVSTMAMMVCV